MIFIKSGGEDYKTWAGLQPATNKASIRRKAALGLRQIAALMAPSASSLRSHPSCR